MLPLHVEVKCRACGHSLMNPQLEIDGRQSIDLQVRGRLGHIFLSQEYGSYDKRFSGVRDIEGSIAEFSCLHCHHPLPVVQLCECQAPVIALHLWIGGVLEEAERPRCYVSFSIGSPDDSLRLTVGS